MPFLSQFENDKNNKWGWPSNKYHFMSWALSCLTIKTIYPNIELVTDYNGARLLVDQLKLPYSEIHTDLDTISNYSPKIWALGKIHAYSIQKDPFIHVDGDVFLWKRFSSKLENSPLIAQNIDKYNINEYFKALQHLKKHSIILPKELLAFKKLEDINFSHNAGILGGMDIDFFSYYSKKVQSFIGDNLHRIGPNINGAQFALIYEQLMFSVLAKKAKLAINCLFDEEDEEFKNLDDFYNRFKVNKYVHLLNISKSNLYNCHEMEMSLLIHYPTYHEIIERYYMDNYGNI